MRLVPRRLTTPAVRILELEDVKLHLRIEPDRTEEDSLLQALILAAESHLDGYSGILGRCMISQQWRVDHDDWEGRVFRLPFPDVSEVAVVYSDADNVEQMVDPTFYERLETPCGTVLRWTDAFPAPSLYDRGDAVRVTMTAGYGPAASDVPDGIIHAAKLLIGGWYENREESVIGAAVSQLPFSLAVKSLLMPFRRVGL
ncbi:head-tail connector protein [Allorhizobium undicola]|uniref:head-tail connector protein n=1 Tax=Allorhizobium undicola TaxID=78527 RepID=UPI0012B5DCBE|nr:head-tail connector protein [Allorhizobium undicola]